MKKGLLCAAICLAGVVLIAGCGKEQEEMTTGMIAGIITDSAGIGLDSALVVTDPATSSVCSDDSGAFQIPDVTPGDYTVTASRRTYIPRSAGATVTAGEIASVDISLDQNARCVLAELLTTACHCADAARDEIYTIKDGLGEQCAYVEYHASCDPNIQTWDPFVTIESEARRLFFGADTFLIGEWMYLDGTTVHYAPGFYQTAIDSLMGIASPLALEVTGSYSSATGSGTINVSITAVDSVHHDDLVVEFAVYDRGPVLYAPDSMCVVPFRYFLVTMPTHVGFDIAYGQTTEVTQSFTVPDTIGGDLPPFYEVNKSAIGVAVFVQSIGTREVLQAAVIDY